ncbi:MAG TPA: hypothetical protein VGR78_19280, partial [Verrucomicrobiae bacterium]|nr:hypothetical protein [Verrucomicrobiae bacterium]
DEARSPAESFAGLKDENISYFINLTAREGIEDVLFGDRNLAVNGKAAKAEFLTLTNGMDLSLTREIHDGNGLVAMADGSVQHFSGALKNGSFLQQAGPVAHTNVLLIP